MKSLSSKLVVIFFIIGLFIFGNAEAWGADWKVLATTWQGDLYYDVESITRPSNDIVRVWTKLITNEAGKVASELLIKLEKHYSADVKINITHNLRLIEYNCLEKQSRQLRSDYYSENFSMYSEKDMGEWQYVSPESIQEDLLRIECK